MIKKREIILGVCICIAAGILLVLFTSGNASAYSGIRITVDGKEYGEYNLSTDQEIKIGETNICRIESGSVKMIYADCPDQLCIHQNPIDENGGVIVCLPNKVVIEATELHF